MKLIYKVVAQAEWRAAEAIGRFDGAAVDRADGYIHFSTADQLAETLRRHFAGQRDLVLVAVDADAFGLDLKWEPSRGGALFPHLYAPLATTAAQWVKPLALGADGTHLLPEIAA